MRTVRNKYFVMLPLLGLLGALILATPGCYDESDACRDYCHKAADCIGCGATTASLQACQDECVALTIAQQKDLGNCAKECATILSCPQMVDFTPPNPCDY